MTTPWVCLMYHDVTPDAPAVSDGPERFAVSKRSFERHLDLLAKWGFSGCSIAAALNRTVDRQVAISFDDGQLGQYERAFPALAARGWTATFFVTTGWVGRSGYVSWDQLSEMKTAGMSIQSHTHTHQFLSELSEAEVDFELRRSKAELDEYLEQDTHILALPGGDPPAAALQRLIKDVGYGVVATSRWGRTIARTSRDQTVFVPRCTVRGEPSDATFRHTVNGDPWLTSRRWVRDGLLRATRSLLGPTRYSIWRSRVLASTIATKESIKRR